MGKRCKKHAAKKLFSVIEKLLEKLQFFNTVTGNFGTTVGYTALLGSVDGGGLPPPLLGNEHFHKLVSSWFAKFAN